MTFCERTCRWLKTIGVRLCAFPAERHFLLLGPVWISFFLIFAISSVIYLEIMKADNLWDELCWSSGCVNHWAHVFKVPIAFMALVVPVVAIMATHHRSAQAARQMYLTHKQNITTNYFSHLKEFKLYISGWRSDFVKYSSENTIYRKLYPRARHSEDGLEVESTLALDIYERIKRIEYQLKSIGEFSVDPKKAEVLVKEIRWFETVMLEFEVCVDPDDLATTALRSLYLEEVKNFPNDLEARLVDVALFLKFICFVLKFDPFYYDKPVRDAEDLLHSTLMIVGDE